MLCSVELLAYATIAGAVATLVVTVATTYATLMLMLLPIPCVVLLVILADDTIAEIAIVDVVGVLCCCD